jgi:autotransporter-associated beta strand protein
MVMVALSGITQELRSSGTVLVDLSAEALTASDGDAIAEWANSGTLGGAFAAVTNNAGVSFTNSLLGKKAVLFSGAERNALTNSIATPASLTGTSEWSMEAWVWVASIPAAKAAYLSWTEDIAANNNEGSRLMFRYDAGGAAVDNQNGSVGYGYGIPAAGAWHHIAVVRNIFKQEKVFVDGSAVAFSWCQDPVQSGIPLSLGAVKKYNTSLYTNFFSGALSRVRVHTGMLSDEDVLHNYLADALSYNDAASTVWTGGSGNWNDSANWTNGVVGASAKAVHVLSGTVAVTNNVSPGILSSLDVVGATLSFADGNARIETKAPFVVGRSSGNAGAVTVSRGTLVVNSAVGPAVLNLGMDGASSSLAIGSSSGAAAVYASQVRAFAGAGSADVQVNSNGVLELDAFVAEVSTNAPAITVSGGTLRSKAGYASMGQFFNVPQAKVSTGGIVFDSVSGSTQTVSTALIHDEAGTSIDGGLRKISAGVLVLSGTNSYTGDTSVEAGTLSLASRLTDGLVYRLDASSNALSTLQFADASNVVAWADANGSGFLFTTNKSEKCPVYDATLFNGRGGLRFRNSSETTIIRLAASRACRAQSVFLVFSPAANNNLGGIWGKSEDDYGIRLQASAVQLCGNGNDFASSGWNYTNGAAGTSFTVGQPLVVTAIAGSAQTWTTAIGDYWGHTTHRRGYRGDIAELLVYDRKLDDAERKAVEQYLMAKWLGTVPAPQFGASVLPSNTVLNVRSGATVDLGGISAQLAALNGAGSIGNQNPTLSLLTLGGLNADSLYAGAIMGNVALTKIGNGRAILAGPNAYTGITAVESGTLLLASEVTSVTGLVYRLDASQTNTFTTLADGSNVTAWADAEGSGFTFAVTNDLNCPVYDATLFDGRGGIRFGVSGARGRMIGSGVTNAQTVFAVNMIRDMSNDNGGFWGKDANDSGLRIGGTTWFWPGNNNDFHYGGNGGLVAVNGVVSNATVVVNQRHLVTSVCGAPQTFKPSIGDYWGSSQWTGRYYRGDVAEILVYDRRLSDLERQTVEAALMAKWFPATSGSVLPQTAAVSVAAGATLDLAAGVVTLGSLAGGGSVSNGALTVTGDVAPEGALSLPDAPSLTGTLTLDIAANGACDSLAVAGALDVSGLALVLNLPETSPSVASYTLVSAAGGVTGSFESDSVAPPWRLIYEPSVIRLAYLSGSLIMIQ